MNKHADLTQKFSTWGGKILRNTDYITPFK